MEDAWTLAGGEYVTPPWLPAGRDTGLTGVLVAGVLQGLVIFLLACHFPALSFIDTPALLVVLLISFGWGAGGTVGDSDRGVALCLHHDALIPHLRLSHR